MSTFSRRQVIGGAGSAMLVCGTAAAKAAPNTTSNLTADVCIVGAGFTGLWTALALKRRSPGTDVVLIDGDVCGGGASGRSGGFAMTWWSKFPSLQKLCGADAAVDLCRRSEEAVADIGRSRVGDGRAEDREAPEEQVAGEQQAA